MGAYIGRYYGDKAVIIIVIVLVVVVVVVAVAAAAAAVAAAAVVVVIIIIWTAVVSRRWAKASACRLQVSLACAVLCQIVSLQYFSRSSLHRLASSSSFVYIIVSYCQVCWSHALANGRTSKRPTSDGGLCSGQLLMMWSAVCSGSPHSRAALSASPHFFMDALYRPTPVRSLFRVVHCFRLISSPLTPSPGSDTWRCNRVGPDASHS